MQPSTRINTVMQKKFNEINVLELPASVCISIMMHGGESRRVIASHHPSKDDVMLMQGRSAMRFNKLNAPSLLKAWMRCRHDEETTPW